MGYKNRITNWGEMAADQFTANPQNWRQHPQRQRDAVNRSLTGLGWIGPVIVNKQTGYIVDGHERVMAALALGDTTPVPYVEVDLTPDEELLALATFDPLGEMAVTDAAQLEGIIDDLFNSGLLDDNELNALVEEAARETGIMLDQWDDAAKPDTDEYEPQLDRIDELTAKWKTKAGQVWKIPSATLSGIEHVIWIADSTASNNLAWITGSDTGAIMTDPPYAFGLGSTGKLRSKSGVWFDMMNNASWFRDRLQQWAALAGNNPVWMFCNWRTLPIIMRAAHDANQSIDSTMVWFKDWIGPGGPKALRPSYELIALFCMGDYAIPDRGVPDMITVQYSSHKAHGHAAEKPTALMRRLLEISAVKRVTDPFLGSGTTLVAAEQMGVQGFGFELEAGYVAVTLERFSDMGLIPRLSKEVSQNDAD